MILDWTGALCIDTLGIPYGSKSPIAIVFLVADDRRNAAMICSDCASSLTLRYFNDVKVDAGLPLLWCPWKCTRDMPDSIYR